MSAVTSFRAELCCRLMNAHTVSSTHLCSSARQFLIHSTFVHVTSYFCKFDLWSFFVICALILLVRCQEGVPTCGKSIQNYLIITGLTS